MLEGQKKMMDDHAKGVAAIEARLKKESTDALLWLKKQPAMKNRLVQEFIRLELLSRRDRKMPIPGIDTF